MNIIGEKRRTFSRWWKRYRIKREGNGFWIVEQWFIWLPIWMYVDGTLSADRELTLERFDRWREWNDPPPGKKKIRPEII